MPRRRPRVTAAVWLGWQAAQVLSHGAIESTFVGWQAEQATGVPFANMMDPPVPDLAAYLRELERTAELPK